MDNFWRNEQWQKKHECKEVIIDGICISLNEVFGIDLSLIIVMDGGNWSDIKCNLLSVINLSP